MGEEGRILVGTSGWSYPSGRGSWNGIFYPPGGSRRGFDELAYYAEHFDTVEVNSTFYRVPTAATTSGWARRTPGSFEFSVKLYQGFTHPKMQERRGRRPDARPGARQEAGGGTREGGRREAGGGSDAAGTEGEAVDPVPGVTGRDVDLFCSSIEPLARAGKIAALLVQFPPSFKQTPRTLEYLDWLLRALGNYSPAVELRHRTWSDDLAATLTLLNGHKAAWVQIDEPKFSFSVRQNRLPNVTGFYYMRLHGRNAANWWKHDKAEDRYDYLYSPEELAPFAETVRAVRRVVRKGLVYFNNHFAAKAVADGVALKHQIGQPVEGEYRRELVEAYPFLQMIPGCRPEPSLFAAPESGREDPG